MSTHLADSDHSATAVTAPRRSRIARYATVTARVLLGLPLIIFGLNAFLNFMVPPPGLPEKAAAFSSALMNSGYMLPLIGVTQILVGVLLLVNCFVPLALVLFAPFIVNAVAFHVFLQPSGLPPALVFFALTLYLAWVYRAAYRPLFVTRWTLN